MYDPIFDKEVFFTDSFGGELPEDWQEICDYLNAEAERRGLYNMRDNDDEVKLREEIEKLLDDYWDGRIDAALVQKYIDEIDDNLFPLCVINMNYGPGRQVISWDKETKKLVSSTGDILEEYSFNTAEEAEEAADVMWGRTDSLGVWGLEWIEH